MKISLKFSAMSILMAELQETQMLAIYKMGMGKEMPGSVTKSDLIVIFAFLFMQLDWIDSTQCSTSEPKDIPVVAEENFSQEKIVLLNLILFLFV